MADAKNLPLKVAAAAAAVPASAVSTLAEKKAVTKKPQTGGEYFFNSTLDGRAKQVYETLKLSVAENINAAEGRAGNAPAADRKVRGGDFVERMIISLLILFNTSSFSPYPLVF